MQPRQHYVQQLEALHTEIRALGQMVIVSITRAIEALRHQDTEAAQRIRAEDQRIDQAQAALEEHALTVMATQQPMAGDLRKIVAAIEIASFLAMEVVVEDVVMVVISGQWFRRALTIDLASWRALARSTRAPRSLLRSGDSRL